MGDAELRDGRRSDLEFLVVTARTDDGLSASTFGFAGRGAKAAGEIAAASLKPFFLGRNPLFREQHWHDFRTADRWWHLTPIYSYGPFDILCWLLSAQAAGQPLYHYLGAYRDRGAGLWQLARPARTGGLRPPGFDGQRKGLGGL